MNREHGCSRILWEGFHGGERWEVFSTVSEDHERRFLVNGGGKLQSGIVVKEIPEPAFQYARTMAEVAVRGDFNDILVLGAGGFCLPSCIAHRSTGKRITVVDREEWQEDVARMFFLKPAGTGIKFVHGEAEEFLLKRDGYYDLVLVDLFDGRGLVPEVFFTSEIFSALARRLRPSAGLLWNLSTGRDYAWTSILGGIVGTAERSGMAFSIFTHPCQGGMSRCNALLSLNLDLELRKDGWIPFGGVLAGVGGFSMACPLEWPEKRLSNSVRGQGRWFM